MKELLHIPSCKFVKFYGLMDEHIPTMSIQEYLESVTSNHIYHKHSTYKNIIKTLCFEHYFVKEIYEQFMYVPINGTFKYVNPSLDPAEFEIIEVENDTPFTYS